MLWYTLIGHSVFFFLFCTCSLVKIDNGVESFSCVDSMNYAEAAFKQ